MIDEATDEASSNSAARQTPASARAVLRARRTGSSQGVVGRPGRLHVAMLDLGMFGAPDAQRFSSKAQADLPALADDAISKLRECHHLPEADIKHLCELVRCILMEEGNIQPVSAPVTVCGDIHGQLWDMVEMFRIGGEPGATNYILMVRPGLLLRDMGRGRSVELASTQGDFVDRGHFSLETFSLLLAFKAR